LAVRVRLAGPLRPYAGGASQVVLLAPAATVGDALRILGESHPGVRDRVLDEQGELRRHVNVFVGPENVRFLNGLGTPLPAEAELHLLPSVSGGAIGS